MDKEYYQLHKEAILAQQKDYYNRNKEKALLRRAKYREQNKDKLNAYCRNYYHNNLETLKQKRKLREIQNRQKYKGYDLRDTYGISIDDYKKLWIEQNGCCAICGRYQFEFKQWLHVDHCHVTEKIRGLLCSNCNTGIGKFKDTPALMDKAKEYLTKHRN